MVRLIDSDNPKTYDKFRKEESSFHKKKYDKVFYFVKKNNKFRVLEVGAGTGTYTRFLVEDFENTTATDLRKEMIEKLKKKKIRAKAVVADSLKLHFKEESFDLFCAISVFHHIDRKSREKFFSQAHRVLKTRGYLVLTDPNKLNPFSSVFQALQGEYAISRFELKKACKHAGFEIVKIGEILARTPETSDFLQKIPFWDSVEKFFEFLHLGVTVFLVARKK